jgi:hypothetical protein
MLSIKKLLFGQNKREGPFLLRVTAFAFCFIAVAELFFRFVLPASEWPRGVILDTGIRRFDSESFVSGRFTYGRYCCGGFRWRINPQGWNSIYEFHSATDRNTPMVAMLGDSYLEGFYSDVDEHVDVYLTEMFDSTISFYTFAMSGGILSQYIALMKYEIEQYEPDAYIVFINSQDVQKSFRGIDGIHPYYFQYQSDSCRAFTVVTPVAESRSRVKDVILRSALVRYLRANAQLNQWGGGLTDENANLLTSVDSFPDERNSEELLVAADFVLQELNSFGRPVLIVADCPKDWIYEGTEEQAFDDVLALRELVPEYGNVSMLELADYYPAEYARTGHRFSLPDNPHWNAYANEFVARTLAPLVADLLQGEESSE